MMTSCQPKTSVLVVSLHQRRLLRSTLVAVLFPAIWIVVACQLGCTLAAAAESGSAVDRNKRLAEQAKPEQREAVLAVTRWGANVIVNAAGDVEAVQLEGCIFPDSVLATLDRLPKLKQLKIGHSKVTDDGLKYLSNLASLESVTLTQTNITDDGLRHLASMPGLKSLSLHMSLVTSAGMQSLARIQTLEQLDIENTTVGDRGLQHLAALPNLQKLLASRTQVTDAGLPHLAKLTTLKELAIYHNDISDAGVKHLSTLVNLKELDLEGTRVTDEGLSALGNMKSLETLNLRYTQVSAAGVAKLGRLPSLKRVWRADAEFSIQPPSKQWQAWLASAYGDDVFIYELGTFQLLKRLVVGPNPHGLSVTEDGRTVHVAVEHFDDPTGELIWVDTATFEITARVDVGPQPQEHECTPDGRWIYVPCGDEQWWVVDGEAKKVVKKIKTGGRPHNTVVSPDGKRMYLSPMGYPHAVTIVDIDDGHRVIGEIPFGDVTRPPAITSDEGRFFENIDNMLGFQVADIKSRQVVHTARHQIPPERRGEWSRSHGLGVRPDQQEIWSCNVEHHMVHIHDITRSDYPEITSITFPGRVYWLSFSPDSKYCFVSIRSKRQVAVVDCDSKRIVTMLDAGRAVKRTEVVGVPLR